MIHRVDASGAEWITAGATVFSAIGTVGALLVAVRLLRHEQIARRAQEEHESRAVPELVSAWWTGMARLEPTDADKEKGAVLGFAVNAVVSNGSGQPVYDVLVRMPEGPEPDLEPGDITLLQPHSEEKVMMIHRRHPGGDDSSPLFGIPSVSFTDSGGNRWCRDHTGALHRDSIPVPPALVRMKESSQRQDDWFATWAENPFSHFPMDVNELL
jgi:hypothetical protein